MMSEMAHAFAYDAVGGFYRAMELDVMLKVKAARPGRKLSRALMLAPVRIRGLEPLADGSDLALRVLIYQLRALRRAFPGVEPELRVALPADYGRWQVVGWYSPAYEPYPFNGPVIEPREVL